MTTEEELLADRTRLALEQWPHLDAAFGCLNCDLLFRKPVRVAMLTDTVGRCPSCSSESVFDVAAALAVKRAPLSAVVGTVSEIIKQLDAELNIDSTTVWSTVNRCNHAGGHVDCNMQEQPTLKETLR